MASEIPQWKNKEPNDKNFEELAIIIQQIIDYLDALDARLTAGGL
jgi:hypothetical protein